MVVQILKNSDGTSNDIIAGNGRILSVHENCVVKYLYKKLYYIHDLFFLFPSDALYSGDPNTRHSNRGQLSVRYSDAL